MGAQEPMAITAFSLATCLGAGNAVHAEALRTGRSGLEPCEVYETPFLCYVGAVPGLEDCAPPPALTAWDNRATRLAEAALTADGYLGRVETAVARWGAARIGVVLGTSTSGVEKLEGAYRAREGDGPLPSEYSMRHHNDHHAVASYLMARLGLAGPCWTISTACSSSAKALVDAHQLIEAGLCDAVIAGGVDSLCLTSLAGFEGLQLVSRRPCRPCDLDRDGLSIGEGAALLLIERAVDGPYRLSGAGECSDGFHMSTPPEDGAGAAVAIREALAAAALLPPDIGYVKLHGTATPANDVSECRAVAGVLGMTTPVSSLKGAIGHTLGAAGAVEAAMCLLALEHGIVPGCVGLSQLDPVIACNVPAVARPAALNHVVANAFGFGGNNCALVLSR
ncbi:MAG: beta-ketoacyl-ACP synthase [Pseudomonadota bacterium]